jgi:hypothetical protein
LAHKRNSPFCQASLSKDFFEKDWKKMINVCNSCNANIVDRYPTAKFCFPCANNKSKKTGASKAISAVQKAVRKGILVPVKTLFCIDCGEPAKCYDHRDYNKPLDVVPVCRSCNVRRGSAIFADEDRVV